MEIYKKIPAIYADSKTTWRQWLSENHLSSTSVWLIIYKKGSGMPSVNYAEALDEALCFGWIDSLPNKRDEKSFYLLFAKRNPKSNWSRVNKEKAAELIKQGRMEKAGMEMIELAKKSGTWDALNEVEETILPNDLKELFDENPVAASNWEQFPRSVKRGILEWIQNAKKPETRNRRIEETVRMAEKNLRILFDRKPT
ncbi:MAG: YdeI/OmpD-associated family protein [Chitinophagaceae bacterium]|nr:YdeI/OmpD-associated family protein [Chitinophagaceae bacterium]